MRLGMCVYMFVYWEGVHIAYAHIILRNMPLINGMGEM